MGPCTGQKFAEAACLRTVAGCTVQIDTTGKHGLRLKTVKRFVKKFLDEERFTDMIFGKCDLAF